MGAIGVAGGGDRRMQEQRVPTLVNQRSRWDEGGDGDANDVEDDASRGVEVRIQVQPSGCDEQIGALRICLQAHSTLIANPRINSGAQSQPTSIYLA